MIPLALLAARMIGDYITQPAWMAENKAGLFAPLRDALITHGDRRWLRQVLQRSHKCLVRRRNLKRQALPSAGVRE